MNSKSHNSMLKQSDEMAVKPTDEELLEAAGDLTQVMDTTNRNCSYRPCGPCQPDMDS